MSDEDDIEEVRRARAVAEALQNGDIDALVELSDVLETSGTPEKKSEASCFSSCSSFYPTQQGTRWQRRPRRGATATSLISSREGRGMSEQSGSQPAPTRERSRKPATQER